MSCQVAPPQVEAEPLDEGPTGRRGVTEPAALANIPCNRRGRGSWCDHCQGRLFHVARYVNHRNSRVGHSHGLRTVRRNTRPPMGGRSTSTDRHSHHSATEAIGRDGRLAGHRYGTFSRPLDSRGRGPPWFGVALPEARSHNEQQEDSSQCHSTGTISRRRSTHRADFF